MTLKLPETHRSPILEHAFDIFPAGAYTKLPAHASLFHNGSNHRVPAPLAGRPTPTTRQLGPRLNLASAMLKLKLGL